MSTTHPARTTTRQLAGDLGVLRAGDPAPADGRFAWAVSAAHLWILVGLFLDGWFHLHRGDNESFFTAWRTLLGVEADLEALLSPPHLLLITTGGAGLPTAVSAAFVVTGLGLFTQYANPFTHLDPVLGYTPEDGGGTLAVAAEGAIAELREVSGVGGVVVWAVLVGGPGALLRARTTLVSGSLAVVGYLVGWIVQNGGGRTA